MNVVVQDEPWDQHPNKPEYIKLALKSNNERQNTWNIIAECIDKQWPNKTR